MLTERGFTNTAPLLGEVVRVAADGTPHTVALAQGFVRNQGDAWGWTLDFLSHTVDELAMSGEAADREDAFAAYASFAGALGRRLAQLHAVLAQPCDDPDFAPIEADEAVLRGWSDSALEQLGLAFGLLRERRDWPDPQAKAAAEALLGQEAALREAVARLAAHGRGAACTTST